MTPVRVAVYGDVDLNLIDGSAIWVQSTVDALASVSDVEVTLLLKAPTREQRLLAPLEGRCNVRILRPFEDRLLPGLTNALSQRQVEQLLAQADDVARFDAVVVRGSRIAVALAASARFTGRLWTYLTDIPQSALAMTEAARTQLAAVVAASSAVLCQTEDLRTHLELLIPGAVGKTVLLPPMVDDPPNTEPAKPVDVTSRPVRLVYSGKLAAAWRTEEMTELPASLASLGIPAELHVVGDKIHDEPDDPAYAGRMRAALQRPGVVWHGGVSRREAMCILANGDVGLSWRAPRLDDSLELSTKVLESGACGRPVLLNRTPAHEALLGADYPLFVESSSSSSSSKDVVPLLATAFRDPAVFELAVVRCQAAARPFLRARCIERWAGLVGRLRPVAVSPCGLSRTRLLVASHDLKFIRRLLDVWGTDDGIEIRLDEWPAIAQHDPVASAELNDWADVVVCEWCGPNAIWYSRHKRPGQRLIVRLHRFELYSSYPAAMDLDAVDAIVTVDRHYQSLVRRLLPSFPADRVVTVPNWVDTADLRREKLAGARFNLGVIGIAPRRKRLDRALDVLAEVRRRDDRFSLHLKSKPPWDYWWIWKDPAERAHYREVFRRIQTDNYLQGSVVLDRFGPDVGAWLRKIGCVLSTSDDESFHLAPAEAMASGATSVVFNWPGSDTVYSPEWIVDDIAGAVESVCASADEHVWQHRRRTAMEEMEEYDLHRVARRWLAVLEAPARSSS